MSGDEHTLFDSDLHDSTFTDTTNTTPSRRQNCVLMCHSLSPLAGVNTVIVCNHIICADHCTVMSVCLLLNDVRGRVRAV